MWIDSYSPLKKYCKVLMRAALEVGHVTLCAHLYLSNVVNSFVYKIFGYVVLCSGAVQQPDPLLVPHVFHVTRTK